MQNPSAILFLSVASLASALGSSWLPPWPRPWTYPSPDCISGPFATLTFTRIRSILSLEPTDLGSPLSSLEQMLAANFESTSDSYSMLAGRLEDVGKVGTIDRAGELAEVGNATENGTQSGIETLALATVGCRGAF